MKPGRVKRNFGVDWFTLLFEFPHCQLALVKMWSHSTVRRVSFWATSFALRVATSWLVISISFRTYPCPTRV
jgi:hypothetical protein